ncbi:MAG: lamin tail domain-containing protein [Candidatus Thermoplasmatota archaeon]|nr:lamin tail domain-containing protein [Candidatus Thermoplasmatota archaeon]
MITPFQTSNAASISERLTGRILLQVEDNGEAWYIFPTDLKRYYLGRPYDAWNAMRSLGLGITNADLARIPTNNDSWDGPSDLLDRLQGYILLQIEDNGEGWYVNPVDRKRYYLGRPDDAFQIMRELGLGATTSDVFNISPNVEVTTVHYAGTASLNQADEFVEIRNAGSLAQTFNTWKIADSSGHEYSFPSTYTLQPGESIRIYTNTGEMNFGNSSAIWNDSGDTAYLTGANDALIHVYGY